MSTTRPLRFAFSTLGCPKLTWEEAAALAARWGFTGVELRALRGGINLPEALKEEFGTPEGMAQALAGSEVKPVAIDASFRLLEPNDAHREEVATLAVWADALGIPYLRVFDGDRPAAVTAAEANQTMWREWQAWQTLRAERGFKVDLMIETHWALVDPDECLRLAEVAGGKINFLWDICHTWSHGHPDLLADWKKLQPWVRHIHLKDIARDETAKGGHRHVVPGAGDLPLGPLLDQLVADQFAGPVSLEWEKLWVPELPELEEALAAGREHGWW